MLSKNEFKTILSLYDYSGKWSKPYRDAGYNVITIDKQKNGDVRTLKRYNSEIYGLLAAPPCTVFSRAGSWVIRTEQELIEALSCVDVVYRMAALYKPKFWAMENPAGLLKQYIGEPSFSFQPWHYGDGHSKLTCLWGKFNKPVPVLETVNWNHSGDITTRLTGMDKNKRSETPEGFARAFFLANQ